MGIGGEGLLDRPTRRRDYNFVFVTYDGREMSFRGTFLEVEPPTRTVEMWLYDGWPDAETVETVELHEADGVTKLTHRLAFRDKAGRDHMTAVITSSGRRWLRSGPGYSPADTQTDCIFIHHRLRRELTILPRWALTGGRAGAAGHVPPRAGSCRDWRQQEPTARPRRVRQAAVQCRELRIEQLSDRDVPSAIARHVLPELPYPPSAGLVGKELHAQVQQVGVRERGHVSRDVAGQGRPPQDVRDLDRHQVRSRQRFARQQ